VLKKIHLQVPTDSRVSDQVLSWFEELNQPPITNSKIWWQCQTVLKEGFDNAVEHAHRALPRETPIELEAIRYEGAIEIRIWDCGTPFDLLRKIKETPALEDNIGEHGRGLKIMEKIADDLRYDRLHDARNCLLIVKYY